METQTEGYHTPMEWRRKGGTMAHRILEAIKDWPDWGKVTGLIVVVLSTVGGVFASGAAWGVMSQDYKRLPERLIALEARVDTAVVEIKQAASDRGRIAEAVTRLCVITARANGADPDFCEVGGDE